MTGTGPRRSAIVSTEPFDRSSTITIGRSASNDASPVVAISAADEALHAGCRVIESASDRAIICRDRVGVAATKCAPIRCNGATCAPSNLCSGANALAYSWSATDNLTLMTGDLARSGQSGYGAGKSETLHWANGLLVFTTNGNGVLDDLKIGQLADITTLPGVNGGTPGLTIWDRELSGRQASWHSSAGIGNWFPPGDPTAGYNLNHPDDRGILPVQMPQTDGFTDRHSVFQGARVYDYEMGQWTSADSSSGGLDNPFSFRRYLYDNGNPNSYSDPSGNDPTCCLNTSSSPSLFSTIGAVLAAFFSFFGGWLFGGGHHSSAPAPPAQVEPQDPSAFANDAMVDQQELQRYVSANQFVTGIGLAGPIVVASGLTAGSALPLLGLGGEVAGAAGVETTEETFGSFSPNYIYSARVLNRSAGAANDAFHNFPESFDAKILQGTRTVESNFYNMSRPFLTNDAVNYTVPGSVNGYEGVFQIGTRPSLTGNTELIMHRIFLPFK